MNTFNDYVCHFLQLIQVKMNNFNDYVCDLLQLIDIFLHATGLAHNLKENPSKITKTLVKTIAPANKIVIFYLQVLYPIG